MVPLTISGRADPVGTLMLGLSPYRPLDKDYQGFLSLIGRQLCVALTDVAARENERHRLMVLADLDRAKTEFYQNVSHELRTPLTMLLAPLQDLLAAHGDDQPGREDLAAAVRAAERLRVMVDALLDFSGTEGGAALPDRQATDLGLLTAEVAGMFRSTAEHAGLRFAVHVPSEPLTAVVDRSMWSTIVTNLVSNAVKYSATGGDVQVTLESIDTDAVLTVTDAGIGIDADQQARVFDRFYRAEPGHAAPGAITKPFSSGELLARVRANHELHLLRESAVETAEARADQIRRGLETNRIIGTAIGIVMARHRLSADQAFKLLTRASQNTNSKLRDIAAPWPNRNLCHSGPRTSTTSSFG